MFLLAGSLMLTSGLLGCAGHSAQHLHAVGSETPPLFSTYEAFQGITPAEKEQIEAFIKRCSRENGARVYFDPLYRGFYSDPSTNYRDLPESCRGNDGAPFIAPMAMPPFMPDRLINIYESLPPTIAVAATPEQLEIAAHKIAERKGCAANNVESARVVNDSIWVQVIVVSMDHYLDADPASFLSEADREAISAVLEQGIPVTISPVYSCMVTMNEWNWDGSEKR